MKKKFLEALLEIGLELLVFALGLGIGALILWAFGVDFSSPDLDYELVSLLGIVIVGGVIVLGYCLMKWIRKRFQ